MIPIVITVLEMILKGLEKMFRELEIRERERESVSRL